MAKFGEGDPRWIVESREDGRNVNQWHWEEADFSQWAHARLKERFEKELQAGLPESAAAAAPLAGGLQWSVQSASVTGEATANTRKKKLILFYELEATLTVSVVDPAGKQAAQQATLRLPYIADENEANECEIQITASPSDAIKDSLRKQAFPVLRSVVARFINDLKDETSSKMNLPVKAAPNITLDALAENPAALAAASAATSKVGAGAGAGAGAGGNVPSPATSASTAAPASAPPAPRAAKFKLKESFSCSPMDLYAAFTDVGRLRIYAGGDSKFQAQPGGEFVLFGGSVRGLNEELVPGKKLVQKWRFSSWKEGVYSKVTFVFDDKGNHTELQLTHEGIPSNEESSTRDGWNENFFKRLKGIFGWGAMAF